MWFIILVASIIFLILYTSISIFYKVRISAGWKIAGFILVCICALKWLWFRLLGNNSFIPDISYNWWIFFEAAFNSLISITLLLIIIDLTHLIIFLISKNRPKIYWLKIIAVIFGIMLGCYGTWEAVRIPLVHTFKYKIAGLPENLQGFKIVQLSDLHIQEDTPIEWVDGVVAKVNELRPDLVVITGDFADGYPGSMKNRLIPLSKLKSNFGVFGVSGNHELYWSYGAWIREFENLGITMLENRQIILDDANSKIAIFGIKDPGHGTALAIEPILPDDKPDFTLGLVHQPKIAAALKNYGDLILSGHTHGGQFVPFTYLVKALNGGMLSGLYDNIYVSPGTALWRGLSFRLGTQAEITEIILE